MVAHTCRNSSRPGNDKVGRTLRNKPPVQGKIDSLRADARGRMEIDEQEYLVADTLSGEIITAVPFRKNRGKIEARLLSVESASADRVEPRCDAFGICGGCRLQHMAPEAQVAWKQSLLLADLAEKGVSYDHLLAPIDEGLGEVGADETGATGDEVLHELALSTRSR